MLRYRGRLVLGLVVGSLLALLAFRVDAEGTAINLLADLLLVCTVTALGQQVLTWVRRRHFLRDIEAVSTPVLRDAAALAVAFKHRYDLTLSLEENFRDLTRSNGMERMFGWNYSYSGRPLSERIERAADDDAVVSNLPAALAGSCAALTDEYPAVDLTDHLAALGERTERTREAWAGFLTHAYGAAGVAELLRRFDATTDDIEPGVEIDALVAKAIRAGDDNITGYYYEMTVAVPKLEDAVRDLIGTVHALPSRFAALSPADPFPRWLLGAALVGTVGCVAAWALLGVAAPLLAVGVLDNVLTGLAVGAAGVGVASGIAAWDVGRQASALQPVVADVRTSIQGLRALTAGSELEEVLSGVARLSDQLRVSVHELQMIRPDGDLDRLSDAAIAAVNAWCNVEQSNGVAPRDLPRQLTRLDRRVVRLFGTGEQRKIETGSTGSTQPLEPGR